MRHISQRGALDCGVAACAMVAGVSYARAVAADHDAPVGRGMSVSEAMRVLYRLTGTRWHVRLRTHRRSITLRSLPPGEHALVLVSQRTTRPHWIAWDGARLFDPYHATLGLTPRQYREFGNRGALLKDVITLRTSPWRPRPRPPKRKRA